MNTQGGQVCRSTLRNRCQNPFANQTTKPSSCKYLGIYKDKNLEHHISFLTKQLNKLNYVVLFI